MNWVGKPNHLSWSSHFLNYFKILVMSSQLLRWVTNPFRIFCHGRQNCTLSKLSDLEVSLRRKATRIQEDLFLGKRATLATCITLIESEHCLKRQLGKELMEQILKALTQQPTKSYRIGLSGPPGAGKSTFIEIFGKFLTSRGYKVAVLAVDPSSSTSGGSLLGDKTRMPELTRDLNAYIRPSPARGHLGGVTRSTNEAIVLCEYAGYDVILVETVGVGQSEFAVTNMVDLFVLLLPPGGGDELQGVKRGIVERADLLVVTKADGDLAAAAHRTQYEYMAALKFMRSTTSNWKAKVLQVSAKTGTGIDKFWDLVSIYRNATKEDFLNKRSRQRTIWMWTHLDEGLKNMLRHDLRLKGLMDSLESQVNAGTISPGAASDQILSTFKSMIEYKYRIS